MRKTQFLVSFVLILCVVVPLSADTVPATPVVFMMVNDRQVDTSGLQIGFDPEKKQGTISGVIETPDWQININAATNPDPFILYAVGVTNNTNAPLVFAFMIVTPVITGPYNQLSSGFNGSMTDLEGDGVTLGNILGMGLLDGANVPAVQLGAFNCTAGPSAPLTSSPCPAGPGFGPVSALVPSANYTSLGVALSFSTSGHDSGSFNGAVLLDNAVQTPEPGSMALIAFGLGLAPLLRRFRRS